MVTTRTRLERIGRYSAVKLSQAQRTMTITPTLGPAAKALERVSGDAVIGLAASDFRIQAPSAPQTQARGDASKCLGLFSWARCH